MIRFRFALVAAFSAIVMGLSASAGSAGTSTSSRTTTSGTAGAGTAACLAHVVGGLREDWYEYYTPGCTGHDEPELDPVSSASRSAQNITWRVQLPADGAFPVSSVGPTFWCGGTVKDTNPHKIGQQGFPVVIVHGFPVPSRIVTDPVGGKPTTARTVAGCHRPRWHAYGRFQRGKHRA